MALHEGGYFHLFFVFALERLCFFTSATWGWGKRVFLKCVMMAMTISGRKDLSVHVFEEASFLRL